MKNRMSFFPSEILCVVTSSAEHPLKVNCRSNCDSRRQGVERALSSHVSCRKEQKSSFTSTGTASLLLSSFMDPASKSSASEVDTKRHSVLPDLSERVTAARDVERKMGAMRMEPPAQGSAHTSLHPDHPPRFVPLLGL